MKERSCIRYASSRCRFKADVMHRSSDLLIPIIEDGIRVLIYAGVNDLMCNFIGNEVGSRTLSYYHLPLELTWTCPCT